MAILKAPTVRSEAANEHYSRKNKSFNAWHTVALVLGAFAVYEYWESAYWFWGLGYAMGTLASNIFVGIDVWADLGIITPMPARIRYLENAPVDGSL